MAKPKVPGLLKGLGVTFGTLMRTATEGAATVQYPHEKEAPPVRARGRAPTGASTSRATRSSPRPAAPAARRAR